jgi:hypothetical protein
MVKFKISKKLLTGCLTTFAAIAATKATIRSAIASPQQLCSNDRPCFHYEYPQKSGNNILFKFDVGNENHQQWEYYNVRYREKQFENRSGKFTITNVQPKTNYKISVQGCNKNFLSSSSCSPWNDSEYKAPEFLSFKNPPTQYIFEKKQEGWWFAGNAGLDYDKNLEHNGKGNGWVRNTSGWNAINNWLNVQSNKKCTVSAWLRTSDTLTDGYMSVRRLNSDGNPGNIINEIKLVGAGKPNPQNKNYNRYSFNFNSGTDSKLLFYVGLWGNGKDSWIQVDDVAASCMP